MKKNNQRYPYSTQVKTLLLVLLFSVVYESFGQPVISGVVVDEFNQESPGVTIYELDTKNGVITDIEGRFMLKCISENPTIQFSYVGYKYQELTIHSDTSVQIIMEEERYGPCCFCYEPPSTKVGINSGMLHNPLGLDIQHKITYFARIARNINMEAGIKWRFLTDEPYLALQLRKYTIGYIRGVRVGLNANYKRIEMSDRLTRIYTVSPDFLYRGYNLSLGYAYQNQSLSESIQTKQGVNMVLAKSIRGYNATIGTIYWMDNWQFMAKLDAYIPNTLFNIAVGWEKINDWQEYDVSLSYRFYYR